MPESADLPWRHVLIPASPTPVESFAAAELARYLALVTGTTLPIVGDDAWDGELPCLSVGGTACFRRYLTPLADGRHEAILLRRAGPHLLLNGNNRRGVLFAVYRFLEVGGGLSFALAGDEHVPAGREVTWPEDVGEQAGLANREIVGHPLVDENLRRIDWLAKNLGNSIQFTLGHWREHRAELLPEVRRRGLDVTIGGHILGDFVSEAEHFDAHPEWFPEIGGERLRDTGQICYCQGGADHLVSAAVRALRDGWAEEIRRFALWFGDNARLCECDGCRQGSFYDHYMGLVSRIQSGLADAGMADVLLDFCIYNADNEHKSDLTLLAPEFAQRPANVNLFYSYWGRDYTQPLADSASPYDAHSYARLREWCARFQGAAGYPRVGEYYADSNQLTAMAPVIPERIRDDVQTYRNAGMDGMHVCVHLWWSPNRSYPIFWVMSFNLHAWLRFAWNPNLPLDNVLPVLLERHFGAAAGEVEALLAAVREAVLPLTRYNLAGPYCSLAGTILWHIPHVPGGPVYTFDPERDEFAAFRRELLADLERGCAVIERARPVYERFVAQSPESLSTANLRTYYTFAEGNLRSLRLQAQAQEAIVADDVAQAKALLAEVHALETGLYGSGTRQIAAWAELYRDSPRVAALALDWGPGALR